MHQLQENISKATIVDRLSEEEYGGLEHCFNADSYVEASKQMAATR